MTRADAFALLIEAVANLNHVAAIGQSGSGTLPVAAECDVDVFVFCEQIPSEAQRKSMLRALGDVACDIAVGALHSAYWGEGDSLRLCGMEVWLLYFQRDAQETYMRQVLDGLHPQRVELYFYPTGRLATLLGMTALYDPRGVLAGYRALLATYPDTLRHALLACHVPALADTEDLCRAISRGDVLFFHFALELAVDHFLQALFALNRCYFPSRKRTMAHAARFALRPEGLEARLADVLRLGGDAATLSEAWFYWQALSDELRALAQAHGC
jgi:hypothetical protein